MLKTTSRALAVTFFLTVGLLPAAARCEPREIHGADSSFRSGSIGICWGMLRAEAGGDVQVIIRIRILSGAEAPYSHYGIQAVHPLTQAAEWVVPIRPLQKSNDAAMPRETFKDLTGRRIFFYRPSDPQPELVVYYMGVPDTTPELPEIGRLEQYFDLAFKRLAERRAP